MFRILVVCLLLMAAAYGEGIGISKDSLLVFNRPVSSTDGLNIYNNTSDSTWIDSALMLFEVIDTTGLSYFLENNKLQTVWREFHIGSEHHLVTWNMTGIGENRYTLHDENEGLLPSNACRIGPGESASINQLQIGFCFVCNSMPRYPQYVKGVLRLYFHAGEQLNIHLYSVDLGPTAVAAAGRSAGSFAEAKEVRGAGCRFLVNGRKVDDAGVRYNRRRFSNLLFSPSGQGGSLYRSAPGGYGKTGEY